MRRWGLGGGGTGARLLTGGDEVGGGGGGGGKAGVARLLTTNPAAEIMIEATLPRPERDGPRGHMTPAEAGEHGRRAQARRLVLTHISDELDPDWARAEAEREFGGAVELAREGAVYTI